MLQSVEMLAVCFRTHSGSGTDCDVRDKKAIDVAAVRAAIDALFAERDALTRQMALRRELQSETDADLAALREAVRCARDYMHTDRCDVHLAPPPGVACLACVRECSALVEMAEAVGQALGPEDAARAKVTL